MIHPSDFDASPADVTPDANSGAASSVRRWKIACFLLGALSIVMTLTWIRERDAAAFARNQHNAWAAGLLQEQETLRSALSNAEAQAAATVRDARVSVTQLRIGGIINGVLSEPADPVEFTGSALTKLQFSMQGRHPLCGQTDLQLSITVTFTLPDGTIFRHVASPADATTVLPPSCSKDGQWSLGQSFGYDNPGLFALGTWRVVVTDRGTIVAQTYFAVR